VRQPDGTTITVDLENEIRYLPDELPRDTGNLVYRGGTTAAVAVPEKDARGYLVSGPHDLFAPGYYEAVFELEAGEAGDSMIATLSVLTGEERKLGGAQLFGRDFPGGKEREFRFRFRLEEHSRLDLRVYFTGRSPLSVRGIRILPLDFPVSPGHTSSYRD
jgi:hypothetical protein